MPRHVQWRNNKVDSVLAIGRHPFACASVSRTSVITVDVHFVWFRRCSSFLGKFNRIFAPYPVLFFQPMLDVVSDLLFANSASTMDDTARQLFALAVHETPLLKEVRLFF